MNYSIILKRSQLSRTESRIELLKILGNSENPLSEKEIEEALDYRYNRTTIYRNLNSLSEKGITQRIFLDDCIKYKLVLSSKHNNSDDHVHFKCTICNRVICMEKLKVRDYPLPKGYDKLENQFLILGICNKCNGK